MKPGYKTTEFWLTLAAFLLGTALASGLIGDGTLASKAIGGALEFLALLGYTAGRTAVKKAESLREAWANKSAFMKMREPDKEAPENPSNGPD
jgi:hypothetical protein